MKTDSRRLSKVKDDTLITLAGVTHAHYIKYKMFFTDFNNIVFPEGYEDRVLATKIDAAQCTISDAFILKSQAKETADVESARRTLLKELRVLAFYVDNSFEGNAVVLKEFLLKRVGKKYRNVDALIGFTKDTLNKVTKYKTELFKNGLHDELIERISAACDTLDVKRREQVEVIRSRPKITQDRREKVNALWKELTKIHKAAKLIFADNPEISSLFDLPRGTRSKRKSVVSEDRAIVCRSKRRSIASLQ